MPTARPRITTERGAPSRVNRRFPLAASVEKYVAKNRVQPANSHQAKHFFSRTMTGANWWQSLAVPIFAPVRLLPRAARGS